MIKIIKPDFVFSDERGTLIQLVREGYSQINVVTSKAGVERGNHYHKLNKEGFFVVEGAFLLEASLNGKAEKYEFRKGDMFIIEPYVMHRFVYKEDTTLVAFYDKGVELPNGTKDIIAEVE